MDDGAHNSTRINHINAGLTKGLTAKLGLNKNIWLFSLPNFWPVPGRSGTSSTGPIWRIMYAVFTSWQLPASAALPPASRRQERPSRISQHSFALWAPARDIASCQSDDGRARFGWIPWESRRERLESFICSRAGARARPSSSSSLPSSPSSN